MGRPKKASDVACGSVIGTDNQVRVQESMQVKQTNGNRAGGNRFRPPARALFARTGMAEFECAWGGSASSRAFLPLSIGQHRATQATITFSAFYFLSTLRVTGSLR